MKSLSKFIILGAVLGVLLVVFLTPAFASHKGAPSVSYPVPELGNCASYTACRDYCIEPTHWKACIDWAKTKGIHRGDIPEEDKKLVFDRAKQELGCPGQESCQVICSKKENFERCNNFSKKTGLVGGYTTDPSNAAFLKRAEEVLDCALEDQCKLFCDKQENKEKCTFFAQMEGVAGGVREVGPGGCTSQQTCQSFCQDPQNKDKCAGFIVTPTTQTQKAVPVTDQNPGPGGCTSEKDCNAFCSDPKNSQECTKYQESTGYQWTGPGGCTSAASCGAYCSKNYTDPECGGGQDAQQYEKQKQQYEQQYQQKQQEFQQMEGQKQLKQQEFQQMEGQYQLKQQEFQQMEGQEQQKQQEYDQMQQQSGSKQQEYDQMMQQQQSQPQAPTTGVQGTSTSRGLLQIILERLGF